ncbi:hypothetical protein HBH69_222920 [Parastagonospora nodorum]|nr:hypothetical protein HBH69_222920 [Parastagonospora nodorum]
MRSGVALPLIKRKSRTMQSATLPRYASSNKGTPTPSRTIILLSQLLTNNRTTLYSIPINLDLQTHIIRQARIEVTAAYALNYLKLRVLKLSKLLQDFFLSANIIALISIVLYNAIKEYYNDRIRKIIYFYSYTIETIHANYIKNSRSNVTVLDDYHDNDVNNILIKYTDNKRQRYNTLIEDYNRAEKREDNILTINKCRTGYSNKKDIEADEREEETRMQLRELLEKIHDILLREFRRANDFIESVTHNDDKQELELEDCNALVERYEEEINYSNLYSTM